jgi:hypothetical protein
LLERTLLIRRAASRALSRRVYRRRCVRTVVIVCLGGGSNEEGEEYDREQKGKCVEQALCLHNSWVAELVGDGATPSILVRRELTSS